MCTTKYEIKAIIPLANPVSWVTVKKIIKKFFSLLTDPKKSWLVTGNDNIFLSHLSQRLQSESTKAQPIGDMVNLFLLRQSHRLHTEILQWSVYNIYFQFGQSPVLFE